MPAACEMTSSSKTSANANDAPECWASHCSLPGDLAVLNAFTDPICALDRLGVVIAANRAWFEFVVQNPVLASVATVGANYAAILETMAAKNVAQAQEALLGLQAVIRGDVPEAALKYHCESPDFQRCLEARVTRLPSSGNVSLLVIHRDVTERERTEAALRASERRYRTVLEDQTEVISRFRADGTILFANEVMCRFFGKTEVELIGHKWQPRAVEEDIPLVQLKLGMLSPANSVVVIENRVHAANGEVRWMQFVNRAFFNHQGLLAEIQSVGRDITERKRAEQLLWEHEELYRRLFEAESDAVFLVDCDTQKFVDANPSAEQMYGYSRDEFRSLEVVKISAEPEKSLKSIHGAETKVALRWHRRRDGFVFPVEISGGYLNWAGKRMHVAAIRDITERLRVENALRKSEAGLKAAEEIGAIGHWFVDVTTGEISWSDQMYSIFGRDSAKGAPSWPDGHREIVHPDDWAEVSRKIDEAVATWRAYELTSRFIRSDGTVGYMRIIGRPMMSADQNLRQVIGIIQDITEQKRLEEERSAALARLVVVEEEERRRLARELHDQTAQRLVALAVELKNLETNLSTGMPVGKQVRSLRDAVDELQNQVRHLAWDLRAVERAPGGLESALREYTEEWSHRTKVPIDYACRGLVLDELPPRLEATVYRVAQEALANVAKHARAHRVGILLEREATLLRLTMEDDGCGFNVEAVQQLSDAGHHLGLLGMKERVTLAGGSLLVESSPGSGTTILLRIPVPAENRPLIKSEYSPKR